MSILRITINEVKTIKIIKEKVVVTEQPENESED